ncbi:hypothetical protein NHX12_007302 [Muraenolepis orangiensis]|uniref:N(6)-L-threonylcarbamoyladenine synthase n=1 Tax=Muraenolepis orangiensis TaxID=630683 RepID=A0A9Q0DMM7_9TELE|nr:hypothetical protein NHX12_007301 [Muraenolepis orangiensis]KAJ3592174.1 hypothetical protein NHX12_007302 [Muraenolepis orangiensis]
MFTFSSSCLRKLPQFCHKHYSARTCVTASSPRLVLGIETSCDETGAAVMDETGVVLGEYLHSQKEVHLKTGGIIPTVAQQLHREHIAHVVQEAMNRSGLLTHWEQLDYGVQFTSSRKFFTISPIILYFLASFYTKYDAAHFVVNTVSLLSVLIPKLPQLHGVRIFGINKY